MIRNGKPSRRVSIIYLWKYALNIIKCCYLKANLKIIKTDKLPRNMYIALISGTLDEWHMRWCQLSNKKNVVHSLSVNRTNSQSSQSTYYPKLILITIFLCNFHTRQTCSWITQGNWYASSHFESINNIYFEILKHLSVNEIDPEYNFGDWPYYCPILFHRGISGFE